MDADRLRTGEAIAGISAVVLFTVMFLPWFGLNGSARSSEDVLAGSVLTMLQAVRNLHALGVPLADALSAATAVPARVVGELEVGRIERGVRADVVVLDDNLEVDRVLVGGEALVVC